MDLLLRICRCRIGRCWHHPVMVLLPSFGHGRLILDIQRSYQAMTPEIAVKIAKLQAQYPWRSYRSICAQVGKGGAEAKRRKNERAREQRKNLYVTGWTSKYENY